jgi:hypothetical protein
MGEISYPSQRTCWIPARCFNLAYLARIRTGGYLQLGLPGMSDNLIFLSAPNWRCWNRKLDAELISWSGFQNAKRDGLHEPVACTLTLHHPYSRTIIHRLYDSLITASDRRLGQTKREKTGRLLLLEIDQSRAAIYKNR